jgi:hypothetical protein
LLLVFFFTFLVKVRYQVSDGAMLLIFFFAFLVRVRYQVSDGLNGEFFSIDWTSFFQSNQNRIKLGSE